MSAFEIPQDERDSLCFSKWTSASAVSSAGCCRAWSRRAGFAACSARSRPNSIRWEFCNIVEADPLRRLRLNISNEKLERLHPADLADIVEELGPAEREAIFETIDSEVAAEALSEIDPKMQASILEALEPEVAADIVEEMSPDEAADALSELEEETTADILDEMETIPSRGQGASGIRRRHGRRHDEHRGFSSCPKTLRLKTTMAEAPGNNEHLLESTHVLFLTDESNHVNGHRCRRWPTSSFADGATAF